MRVRRQLLQLPAADKAHGPDAALLVDFGNVPGADVTRLAEWDRIRGRLGVQRAYADWRRYGQFVGPLSEAMVELVFAPFVQLRLAIDAAELVYAKSELRTFILVSGNSDFASLVLKLREHGKYVIGVGNRGSASRLLVESCDEYYWLPELMPHARSSAWPLSWTLVTDAVKLMTSRGDIMRWHRLREVMLELDPTFNERKAGFSDFKKLVKEAARQGHILLIERRGRWDVALGRGAGVGGQEGDTEEARS
jgi:hypothetical protein